VEHGGKRKAEPAPAQAPRKSKRPRKSRKKEAEPASIGDEIRPPTPLALVLPNEVLQHVLFMLPTADLANATMACRQWFEAVDWARTFANEFGVPPLLAMNWRQRYLYVRNRMNVLVHIDDDYYHDLTKDIVWAAHHGFARYFGKHAHVTSATPALEKAVPQIAKLGAASGSVEILQHLYAIVKEQLGTVPESDLAYSLVGAVQHGWVPGARFLLQQGAFPDGRVKDAYGLTCLMISAYGGDERMLRLLLQYGADPNLKTLGDDHRTALHEAASAGHTEAIRLLLDAGARIDQTDDKGRTPLFYACLHGDRGTTALLLERGADPGRADVEGCTPLRAAQWKGQLGVVDFLRQSAAGRACRFGGTAVHD
jgi:hypothetical protein